MAKKLNKNLVLGLAVLGFAITTAAGIALVQILQRSDPAELAAKGERYAKSEDPEDWLRAYQYYNRAYNVSDDARYLIPAADMFRKLGREGDALKMLKTAVVVQPDLLEAQEKILDLDLEISRMSPRSTDGWLEVKTTAQAILDLPGQENHARALYGMGAALLGLKELSPENESLGVEYLGKAIAADPTAVEPVQTLFAHLCQGKEDKPERELYECPSDRANQVHDMLTALVAQTTKPGKDAADARCLLAQFYIQNTEEFDRAAELYTEAQKVAGDDKEVQADVHAEAGTFWRIRWTVLKSDPTESRRPQEEIDQAYANAVTAADKSIAMNPQGFQGYFLRAELYRLTDDVPMAIKTLERRLDLPFMREGFKSFLTRAGRYSLLIALADLNISMMPGEERGSAAFEQHSSEASRYIEDALGEFPERPEASHSHGKLAYVRGEFSEAVKWFERSDEQSALPNPLNLHYLALARLQLGQTGAALEAIQRAASLPKATVDIVATYAQILQRTGHNRAAVDAANAALRVDPTNAQALLAQAAAYEALGESERVMPNLEKITKDQPQLIAAQARFLASQKKEQQAIDLLQKALAQNASDPQLVSTAAEIYRTMNRLDDARALIDTALAAKPDDFELRLAKLRFSDLDEAARRKAYTELIATLPDEYDRVIRLAAVHAEEDNAAEQRTNLERAKDLLIAGSTPAAQRMGQPALRAVVDRLFELYTREEDYAALDRLVAQTAEWNNGAGLDGAEGLSYRGRRMLIDGLMASAKSADAEAAGDNAGAKRLADQAAEHYRKTIDTLQLALDKFPSSGETYAQLGEAYLQTNRLAEARAAMEKSNDLLPNNPAVIKRLAYICRRLNDDAGFRNWLALCRETIPDDPWVIEQSIIIDEETNPREGIARREKLRRDNPDDIQNLAALARLYHQVGDTTKARECVDALLALKDIGQYAAPVAALLRELDEPERALSLLEQNLRDAPNEDKAEAQLLIAAHLAATSSPKADAAYLAAADIEPTESVCLAIGQHFLRTGRPAAADDWFNKGFKLAKEAKSPQLSMIYQIRIDTALRRDRLEEARELAKAFKSEFKDDPAASFLDSEIHAASGEVKEAIEDLSRFLESARERGTSLADYRYKVALYRRAQLNGNRGNWQETINDLVTLVGADATALDFKPRLLLSRAYDQVGRADAALGELEAVYRDHPEATDVVAELVDRYIADQRYGDADRVLAAMLNRDPENPAWLTRSGDVAVAQEDRTKALANYKLAAKVAGYTSTATNKLFDACMKFKLPDQGISFFEESIPPGQQSPEIVLGYARLLASRGDTAKAVDMCRLALYRRGFGSFEFLQDLTQTAMRMMGSGTLEKFQTAPTEQVFERANQHILSLMLQYSGKGEEARKIDDALLESATDPKEQSHILFRRGLTFATANDPASARKAYEDAVAKDSSNLAALNNLAYLLADSAGEEKEAVAYAKQAVEVASQGASTATLVDTLDTLGYAYLRAGDVLNAIARLNRAVEIDPDYLPAQYHLGEAFRRNGQFEAAVRKFEAVLKAPQGGPYQSYLDQAREGLEKANQRQAD